jgi:glycine betaine/choline ABC-type transport system substrate-binding protein
MRSPSRLLLLLLLGCAAPAPSPTKMVRYGFKNFTESRLIGEMFALLLNAAGFVTTHGSALNSSEARNSLLNNDIDIYAEYTGTALEVDLGITDRAITNSPDNIETVRAIDLRKNLIVWGDAAHLNNSYTIAVTKADASGNNLSALSDLAQYTAAHPGTYKWIVNKEFYERVDGLFGLLNAYSISLAQSDIIKVNETETSGSVYGYYQTIMSDGNHYAVLAYATDAQLIGPPLVALSDDKHFFPYYAPAANVRQEFLARYPEIITLVDPIASLLTNPVMAQLNYQVDFAMLTPEQVAHDFLVQNRLLQR